MFDKTEINQIDKKYFQILQANGYHIIQEQEYKSYLGYFKTHPKTVMETQELIKSHDKWHLQNR